MNNKPIVFMFSGQGSHYYQMGRELFDHHPVFRKWMRTLDQAVHEVTGTSVLSELYDDARRKSESFTQTSYTHPAIFMVEYALTQMLLESGIRPDYVLGASMGEFASAAVVGVLDFEDALTALLKQVELLDRYCQPGGMTAILHHPDLFYETPLLHEQSEFAGQNFETHFVVSGRDDALAAIERSLRKQQIVFLHLPVSLAFHSSLIDPAAPKYKDFLRQHTYQAPRIPMISCAETDILSSFHQEHLWNIIHKPIAFQQTILTLERKQSFLYIDMGPLGTLANFVKQNLAATSQSQVFHILSPFGRSVERFAAVKKCLTSIHPVRGGHGDTYQQHSQEEETMAAKRKTKHAQQSTKITWVFPGQGSQKKGMGKALFDEFSDLTAQADAILGYSVQELCVTDPQKQLSHTQYTQPALFIVNAFTYLKKCQDTDRRPDFVAGHSLGEYDALFAAGGIDFETGVTLVKKRGELMGQASGGTMAAVLKLTEEQLMAILEKHQLTNIDVANYNSPSQIVISGLQTDIDQASELLKAEGGMCIPLKVSAAFHSRHMQPAQAEFEKFLQEITFSELAVPLISNVTARPYKYAEITANLARQITHPVKWTESIRYLMGKGAMEFEEIGPGNVLTKLVTTIQKDAEPLIVAEEEETAAPQPLPATEPEAKPTAEPEAEPEAPAPQPISDKKKGDVAPPSIAEKGAGGAGGVTPESLGDDAFKQEYHLKYAYLIGAMVRGIASKEIVVKMGKAGLMGYWGAGGMGLSDIEATIRAIQQELPDGQAYGMNLLANIHDPQQEDAVVDLYLKYGIRNIEAAAYMQMTPSLVKYRLKGLQRDADGRVSASNRIMGKISRPEVAQAFLNPAPERIVKKLLDAGQVSQEEAELAKQVPMATALCVEADSGGHTDQGIIVVVLPAIIRVRDELMKQHGYAHNVWVGAAGGIGTPEAAATAFMLGADFILTGSINQCTVEAGTSDTAKDILQGLNVQDTDYAPAADMFELGAKVQVVRKGVFFPARANKLYDMYRLHNSWDEIEENTKKQIQEKYFKCSFEEIWAETAQFFAKAQPKELKKAERDPKHKMALVFRWYLWQSMQFALQGKTERKVDFQIHCGPAMGAFNQWVKGTALEDWHNRHVDEMAEKLMQETAALLNRRFQELQGIN
ncbi:MAG: ACP S-malonyltransferase [bacterium]|nr:ACP S-malonyltransferase [bacterium]